MNGKTNRAKGHNYEREICKKLNSLGFDCCTSRYASRELDDKKVDVFFKDKTPLNIQCKNTLQLNARKVLKEMPEDSNHNVIFWKKKREGSVAVLPLDDFLELLEILKSEKIF
jgi:Holliday junction resolvase